MISPERLRRYPHCAGAGDELLRHVAMLAEEKTFDRAIGCSRKVSSPGIC